MNKQKQSCFENAIYWLKKDGHPSYSKDNIGIVYAGAFVIWCELVNGTWQALERKPKTRETVDTMTYGTSY